MKLSDLRQQFYKNIKFSDFVPISPNFQKIPIFWATLRPISQSGYAILVSNNNYIDCIALNLLSKTKIKALSYLFLEI